MTALELINLKEILTNEERDVVKNFDPELDKKYLNYLGERGWLNINVYSEADKEDYDLRQEIGI